MTVSEQEVGVEASAPVPSARFSWRGFLVGVLVGVFLLMLWFGVAAAFAAKDARSLQASASQINGAVAAGDYQAAAAALNQAGEQAAGLDSALSSAPLVWVRTWPKVGPTAVAAGDLAQAVESVLVAAKPLEPALESAAAGDLLAAIGAVSESSADLQRVADAAAAARLQVAEADADAVIGPLQGQFRSAQTLLLRALDPLAEGATTARVLPGMLGVGAPARWLVVLAQPSEARGSGAGFYGAYLTLDVVDGRFTLGTAAANGPETGEKQDLSLLPAEYRRLWGSDAEYLWGYNLSRHYPYTASVIHRALDPGAGYVVSMDPRAVAGLMALSGPVTVDGITIDASNAEAFFTRDIYVGYPNDVAKDQVTLAALQQVFAALGSVDSRSPAQWVSALGPAFGDGHIQVWSPDPAVQDVLSLSPLGGSVPQEPSPWVTVAFNNSAGNKIDSYVKTAIDYTVSGDCAAGPVSGTLAATLSIDPLAPGLPPYISGRNDEPGAPYGTTSMLVHLYGPPEAIGQGSVMVNGQPVPAVAGMERGHPVWGVKVQLAPDAPVTVEVNFTQPAYPGQPLVVQPQPMVQDTVVNVDDRRSC